MILLAILTGSLTLFNYYIWANYSISENMKIISLGFQFVLLLLTIFSVLKYSGRKSRPSYSGGYYKVWTLRFAIIILSFIGNISVFIVLLLNYLKIINKF